MKRNVLIDTGPLVAFVNHRDAYHSWILQQVADIQYPLLTCEAVLTEACFLLQGLPGKETAVLEMVSNELLVVPFHLPDEATAVTVLMRKYVNIPMSVADACLVRMAELYSQSVVLTLDSDFQIYRKHGRQRIPCLMPENR